jgi:hypothetical protein
MIQKFLQISWMDKMYLDVDPDPDDFAKIGSGRIASSHPSRKSNYDEYSTF